MPDAGELVHDLLLLVLELQVIGEFLPGAAPAVLVMFAEWLHPVRRGLLDFDSIRTATTSPGTALDMNTTFPSIRATAFPSAPTDSTVTPRTISFSFFLLMGAKIKRSREQRK